MRILCPISGERFYSSTYFKSDTENFTFTDIHPIFRHSRRQLLAKTKSWAKLKYSETEEKLLFLALLNSTEHVEWTVAANPKPTTVGHYMERLVKLVAWYDFTQPGNSKLLKLPSLRISEHNSNLASVGSFLTSWYEVRKEWMSDGVRKELQDSWEVREAFLHRMIHSYLKPTEEYASRLGAWAIAHSNVEGDDKKREWLEIFKLKDEAIFSVDSDEIEDCYEWMCRELYVPGSHAAGAGATIAAKVIQHLSKILKIAKGGRSAFISYSIGAKGPSDTFRLKVLESEESADTEELLLLEKLESLDLPPEKPKISDYKNNLKEFVKADLAWAKSQQLREDLAYLQEMRKSKKGLSEL